VADELFDVFCPTCNIQVQARATCSGCGAFSSNAGNPLDEIETEYHGDRYSTALCPQCNDPFLIKQSRYSVVGEFETVTTKVVLYPTTSRLPADGIPEPVSRAYCAVAGDAPWFNSCVPDALLTAAFSPRASITNRRSFS